MSVLRDYATAVSQPTLPFDAPGTAAVTLGDALRYDEVVMPDGGLRPAWRAMASLALALTPDELRRVDGEIMRFLADEGVTYVDRGTGSQPWQLDPVPLVLDAADWSRLEVGLAQRAELLNAVLADLYGPQRLLSSGVIPASVIFGHSGSHAPSPGRAPPRANRSCCRGPTSAATPTASGASSPIACRHRPASATRCRTGASSRRC